MTGYWNNEKETAIVMKNDWFKTGDIGIMDAEGFIKIVDRKKEMINVSGMKVFPNEVEDILTQMKGILEAGVIGVESESSGEVVKAFVVLKDTTLTKETILEHCRLHLVAYKVPKYIVFRDELPKSNIGKILRKELTDDVFS